VFLTITSTAAPATDLGYLLHKHPERVQTFDTAAGPARVFYPEADEGRCTAALLLEVDPVGLVRSVKGRSDAFSLGQYVNDRPYAASSLLAVALGKVFRTAMSGRCDARPELVDVQLPLEIHVPALPCRGGPRLASALFEPLGWEVRADPVPLDPELPGWGDSRYVDLRLAGRVRLADALNHLYVLLPVLDDAKHYWVGPDEVDKLVRAGGGWLASHPERELISRRYLAHRRALTASALARLAELDDFPQEGGEVGDDQPVPAGQVGTNDPRHAGQTRPNDLASVRREVVVEVLREVGARRVADVGCGEGALVGRLLKEAGVELVVAADVSSVALERLERRLRVEEFSDRQRERLSVIQSSVTYSDERLAGLDAIVLMEVIEHVDPPRLPALGRVVFGAAKPAAVVVTTPNVEHNVRYPALAEGEFRHPDHRFEWTRAEFRAWASQVAAEFGYDVAFRPVGPDDPEVGPPSQLALFRREAA
jgi:3' terminal RNA ribose 2'-O-methyltransferase Hen1